MVQDWIWKRAVALLVAAGLFAVLVAGISADDEYEEAVAAHALKPTQAIAEVPEEFNELFLIQWGGGSLYHLKARLATMGCMLNTIWVYENREWYSYNQYNVPDQLNQPFLARFKDHIPPTTLYGTCIGICARDIEFGDLIERGECQQWEDILELWILDREDLEASGHPTIDDDAICTDDFNPIVKEKVFSLLPVLPDTCIVRQVPKPSSFHGRALAYTGYIVLWFEPVPHDLSEDSKESRRIAELSTEMHELCHMQQSYYIIQQEKLNRIDIDIYHTDAYKEFMALTGFTASYDEASWAFQLPDNSMFKEIYSINPVELSAELCSFYILENIWEQSGYTKNWHADKGVGFNPQKYLTPEVKEWLETYMVLPYPNYGEE